MADINPTDIVDVTLGGASSRTLAQYEVLKIPSNVQDYWEFQGPSGDIVAVPLPIAVTKSP